MGNKWRICGFRLDAWKVFIFTSAVLMLHFMDIHIIPGLSAGKQIKRTRWLVNNETTLAWSTRNAPVEFSMTNHTREFTASDIQPCTFYDPDSYTAVQNAPGRRRRYPTAIIIGAKKSGTTQLFNFLEDHPGIVGRPGEAHFFESRINDDYDKKGFQHYLSGMPASTKEQITMEKTPIYMITPCALRRIHRFNSDMRIIMILRDPIKRILSDFKHNLLFSKFKMKFGAAKSDLHRYVSGIDLTKYSTIEEYLFEDLSTLRIRRNCSIVEPSLYSLHLRNVLSLFPRRQVHIIDGDEFTRNPLPVLKELEVFLGVRPFFDEKHFVISKDGYYCYHTRLDRTGGCDGAIHRDGNPELNDAQRKALTSYLRPYVKDLWDILDYKMSWAEHYE